ncbi:MAG TPA: DUF2795 domain-containing protein [Solirubrobacteraceae bacterium]|nr:DUF2795 domain-containing protein [Solirubrobacteraceae bacterium]
MDDAPVEVTQKHIDGIAWPASKEEVLEGLQQNGAPDDVLQAVRSADKDRFAGPNDLHAILWKAA